MGGVFALESAGALHLGLSSQALPKAGTMLCCMIVMSCAIVV